MIIGWFMPVNTQTQYLLLVSAAGAELFVEAITAVIRRTLLRSSSVYGAPLGVLWECVCIVCESLIFVLLYRFQKHVRFLSFHK